MSIINLSHSLNRPEYVFQPKQFLKRSLLQLSSEKNEQNVILPWGTQFKVSLKSNNKVSHSLFLQGIYDLSLTEAIFRLLMPDETALDIGANIGYITSLMANRVGKYGQVYCFEPNPKVYEELCETIRNQGWNHVTPSSLALSNQSGSGFLVVESDNTGEGYLTKDSDVDKSNVSSLQKTYSVNYSRLDEFVNISQIDLIKIDVEGHELEVFKGAGEWISKGKVRDIVFEEHRAYPNETMQFLESCGYRIFGIEKGFWKPVLRSPDQLFKHPWEPPNYLATVEPDRAIKLLSHYGWKSLKRN